MDAYSTLLNHRTQDISILTCSQFAHPLRLTFDKSLPDHSNLIDTLQNRQIDVIASSHSLIRHLCFLCC